MQIATRRVYDVMVDDMSGRLDSHSSGDAGDRFVDIVQGHDKRIVLNLSKLDYVSSAGLRVILRGAKLLQEKLGELNICGANQTVGSVLLTACFYFFNDTATTEKEAFAAFRG